jgi:hypothetical protein
MHDGKIAAAAIHDYLTSKRSNLQDMAQPVKKAEEIAAQ